MAKADEKEQRQDSHASATPSDDLTLSRTPEVDWSAGGTQNFEMLFRWVESAAIEAFDWYVREKHGKARISKTIRVSAVLLLTAGGVIPILALILHDSIDGEWGFVALAVGAGALLLDRAFGFSSSWARYATAAMQLKSELLGAQLKWAAIESGDGAEAVPGVVSASRMSVITGLAESVMLIVRRETQQWADDFHENLSELRATLGSHPR
jgi:SMODS and SLOG-associating 2TM effector domain 2